MKRNISLTLSSIVISGFVASLFGGVISQKMFGPSGFEGFFVPQEIINFVNSFPFVYILLSTILFLIFGRDRKWIWLGFISILPVVVVFIYIRAGIAFWLWFGAFFVSGIILVQIINFLSRKNKDKGVSQSTS
ncbi:MAG: hypothetical protein A2741_03020 [Candidatus Zambryskibacteria bacterium RIFCSPHIGHO2_01_FULL_43_27]|uniref:Uncharacterized protein n=1 Tax=Candidatus Zambryskibacteria bacterium RIFCSPLOWO2_01_FULL_43_17 TaxID=1802760 RepID=A0A1G2U5R6_9BACT|nr:MAG: hypothetical protein A2741_03020 [Candidatus Zambryskibacteria bacterium RIFCSPHIGHO2_01_FULL_43_27]OHA99415.1 MAG: hypothetical protein A3E93_00095 [Candidatus Zambryskibacteria bacterium RIFCSPHIGHO2_12_FULL_43_12b]OHB04839.1 MAG: hypothetical protein A2920_00605 [Candidatus Zambryskibacteria bacterium RIFCSPLOWO2_01_FULL_43_17]